MINIRVRKTEDGELSRSEERRDICPRWCDGRCFRKRLRPALQSPGGSYRGECI